MAEVHFFLIVETVLLFGASLCGFIASITIGVTRDKLGGCPLYGEISWYNATAPTLDHFGSSSSCNFCVGVQVIAALYALGFAFFHIYVLIKREDKNTRIVPPLLVNTGLTIIIFIQACVVSVGFLQWCKSIEYKDVISECREGQRKLLPSRPEMDFSSFFDYLTLGEIFSWISCLLFGVLACIIIGRCLVNRRRQPTKEAYTTSENATIADHEQIPGVI
ncbi:transmembrane protein 179-like isoform X2 [Saccoglossus kowalevskii]